MRTDLMPVRPLMPEEVDKIRFFRRKARFNIVGAVIMTIVFAKLTEQTYFEQRYGLTAFAAIVTFVFLWQLFLAIKHSSLLSNDIRDGQLYRFPAQGLDIKRVQHKHAYHYHWDGIINGQSVNHRLYLADKRLMSYTRPEEEPEWYITTANMGYVVDIEVNEDYFKRERPKSRRTHVPIVPNYDDE